jgi:hypothetical protein
MQYDLTKNKNKPGGLYIVHMHAYPASHHHASFADPHHQESFY